MKKIYSAFVLFGVLFLFGCQDQPEPKKLQPKDIVPPSQEEALMQEEEMPSSMNEEETRTPASDETTIEEAQEVDLESETVVIEEVIIDEEAMEMNTGTEEEGEAEMQVEEESQTEMDAEVETEAEVKAEVEAEPETEEETSEPTEPEVVLTEEDALSYENAEDCKDDGGSWIRGRGADRSYLCLKAYSDAGQPCANSDECQGKCLGRLNEETEEYEGYCQKNNNPFGCFVEMKKGEAQDEVCVE